MKFTLIVLGCDNEITFCPTVVTCDKITHELKGQTVMTEEERYECVRHCRYVDEVIPDCPWTITPDFLEKHQVSYRYYHKTVWNVVNG